MSQKDTSYVHTGSTLCMRTNIRKYNAGGYASGTDIAMHLMTFVLIDYICGFITYSKKVEYTKDQWIDKKHHDVLQWDRNSQNIIIY